MTHQRTRPLCGSWVDDRTGEEEGPSPVIQRSIHVLAVQDLEASSAYYQDVLGFSIYEIGDPGWRMFELGACRIMVGHCPDEVSAGDLGDHSYFAYLVVEDIDAYYDRVAGQGGEIIKPLQDEPWGMREFGLMTVDGHRMMIGQDLDG